MQELHGRTPGSQEARRGQCVGILETEVLEEAEEWRHLAWVGQGEDREGNGQEDWVEEMLSAEDLQPRDTHFTCVRLWRPDWFSFFKQKCLPSSVQHRLVL